MDQPDFVALCLAAAGFLELRIDPAMQAGVCTNLALLHQHATRVMQAALTVEEAPAPVFRP